MIGLIGLTACSITPDIEEFCLQKGYEFSANNPGWEGWKCEKDYNKHIIMCYGKKIYSSDNSYLINEEIRGCFNNAYKIE
jgi:hypothetical protein